MANKTAWMLLAGIFLFSPALLAQKQETTGWIFLSHTQHLTKGWDLLFDAQVRSTDRAVHVNTLLLRSALGYNFSKEHAVALGYAFKGDWEQEGPQSTYQPEHRVYEQYLFSTKLSRMEATGRFRLEQRFVKEKEKPLFSQRARGFLALQIPVIANRDFSKGVYVNIQNELFVNIQHKEHVNNAFFDQNRLLGSAGYRFSQHLDAELGLQFWRQLEMDGYRSTRVIQLMLTTSL